MKWLRQQRKVESLSTEVKANGGHMRHLRYQLVQRVHWRLQQPGTLAWAFAAGCLFGSAQPQPRSQQAGSGSTVAQKMRASASTVRYLNFVATILNLLFAKYLDQQMSPDDYR